MKRSAGCLSLSDLDENFLAHKRQRSDSMETQADSEQDINYAVQCCKCPTKDEFDCLQSAYDYGWYQWEGDYCPAHAEEGIFESEQYAEDQHIKREVSFVLNAVISKIV